MTVHDSRHEQWEELAAGYALHALEPDEELLFTAHLQDCSTCRATVGENDFIAAQLGTLAEPSDVEAPPSWSSIREKLGTPAPAVVVDLRARRQQRARRVLAAAAAVVVVAGAATAGWQLHRQKQPTGREVAAVRTCLAQVDCSVVRLPSGGQVKAEVLVQRETARVVPVALSAPPAGHVYMLWQMPQDGRPLLVSAVRGLATGVASAPAPLALPYRQTTAFAMSIERDNSVPAHPSSPLVAIGAAAD